MNHSHSMTPARPAPRSLFAPDRFLSKEEVKALCEKIVTFTRGGGEITISVKSRWSGASSWARSRMLVTSDVYNTTIAISRKVRGARGSSQTTRMDEEGLRLAVRDAEEVMRIDSEDQKHDGDLYIEDPILNPVLWSDPTYAFSPEQRTDVSQRLIDPADRAGLMSAGTLRTIAEGYATYKPSGLFRYYPVTGVECSTTCRDREGTASGWAGVNHYGLEKIDTEKLAATALDKCLRMRKPSAVEPGRYTVILEPQAMADLIEPLMSNPLMRPTAEQPAGPFGKSPGWSKIGEQVLDRRLVLRHDPMDADGAFVPFQWYNGEPYRAVNWIDRGVLRDLSYSKEWALRYLGEDKGLPNSYSFRLMPAPGVETSTVEQMISRTERGLLITRLHNVTIQDGRSVQCTGYTRDGIWLIEHGKISRPVKNFRFTESPLFVLNKLEDIGVPQRVFQPGYSYVAPAVRVNDFSVTSLADAV